MFQTPYNRFDENFLYLSIDWITSLYGSWERPFGIMSGLGLVYEDFWPRIILKLSRDLKKNRKEHGCKLKYKNVVLFVCWLRNQSFMYVGIFYWTIKRVLYKTNLCCVLLLSFFKEKFFPCRTLTPSTENRTHKKIIYEPPPEPQRRLCASKMTCRNDADGKK